MQNGKLIIRRAAVLGAGVMGAQIATHLANADVPVVLFDLPAREGDKNGVVQKALDGLKKLEPAPAASADRLQYVDAANYDDHLPLLGECDLVIEAIAEKIEWKDDLYRKIAPHLAEHAIVASNTSGLSINRLAEGLPVERRANFCGIHFFNPPRYMALVELIPTEASDPAMLDTLESWFTTRLGKSIVRAKDTPNFIANRVGVFSILAVMHHTERLGLGFDETDALTGPRIGRPRSATYRTADVVGLDTLMHVVNTMKDHLADDPWHAHYRSPDWMNDLIAAGSLGQKSGGGVFKKIGKEIQVLDPVSREYRPSAAKLAPEVEAILADKSPAERFAKLRACEHPQAQLLWSIFRDVFHYCAVHLESIADSARDIDFAMRWGFGWSQGPFETWQAAGWKTIATAIQEDIAAGLTMASEPLPAWVFDLDGVHTPQGSWSVGSKTYLGRSALPVYQRQLYPETVLGEAVPDMGETLWENEGVRLWQHPLDRSVAILSLKSKMHAIGDEVLDGVLEALARAERSHGALVIWHQPPFSVGANLKQFAAACSAGNYDWLENMLAKFQKTSMALKYAQIPTVAAVQGMALGGGAEFMMHTMHRVVALETRIGLVESGVGLIPAGGGCKELALRADRLAKQASVGEPLDFVQAVFMNLAAAKVATSALQARDMGYVQPGDDVILNPHELLYVAIRRARAMAEAGHHAGLSPRGVRVAGRAGVEALEQTLSKLKEEGRISEHDYQVGRAAALALCGGEVEPGSMFDEEALLTIERQQFLELLKTEATQQRIAHMLETGKPLRN
ncbi:3-hydroxyacyl-CoA dehydrogenase/enoyl-CoA hydratase family protein [Crenobacter sp. SG2305]|uniref:3-hydroxyacyl-CoA dehydrogenase/enoyl-CoA hydratase family protein n=1 Tax=Crenobacter oryzisoli TaxID=3056844 RepID=UPI0025AAAC5F|nr:3-hydroxyacyl-CoA dehydrogenase/enoyl-CoA hydratase family protein [Crenobacter sp. SG2305]MDN0082878.1 3-hydroxyacyl-CoA dehydrogenase/enoyl-CoA hydratase family protein [Crenobacter sp. SG2305]